MWQIAQKVRYIVPRGVQICKAIVRTKDPRTDATSPSQDVGSSTALKFESRNLRDNFHPLCDFPLFYNHNRTSPSTRYNSLRYQTSTHKECALISTQLQLFTNSSGRTTPKSVFRQPYYYFYNTKEITNLGVVICCETNRNHGFHRQGSRGDP